MRGELTRLHARTGKPFVYVTHDQVEAMSMSDVIVVMMDGCVVQTGSPRDLYARPASRAVAGFIGAHPINFVEAGPGGPLATLAGAAAPGPVLVGLRPEGLHPDAGGPRSRLALERIEYLGSEALLHCRLADGTELRATAPQSYAPPAPGTALRLAAEPGHLHLFDPGSGARIEAPASAREGQARHEGGRRATAARRWPTCGSPGRARWRSWSRSSCRWRWSPCCRSPIINSARAASTGSGWRTTSSC